MSQTKKKIKVKPEDPGGAPSEIPVESPVVRQPAEQLAAAYESTASLPLLEPDPDVVVVTTNPTGEPQVAGNEPQSELPADAIEAASQTPGETAAPAVASSDEAKNSPIVEIDPGAKTALPPTPGQAPAAEPVSVPAVPEPASAGFSRGGVIGLVVLTNFLTLVLALVVALGILANLNGGSLQYALPSDLKPLEKRLDTLETNTRQLEGDADAIRARLDNLESMSGRLTELEKQNTTTRSDLKRQGEDIQILSTQAVSLTNQLESVSGEVEVLDDKVSELQASSSRYQQFLDGLVQLLKTISPEGNTP